MLAIYQPKRTKPAWEETFDDGRQVLNLDTAAGLREYKYRLEEMAARQENKCAICLRIFLIRPEFDHQDGRGMNGANRDDRIVDEHGNWINAALCHECNTNKASKRYAWIDELYLPIRFLPEAA